MIIGADLGETEGVVLHCGRAAEENSWPTSVSRVAVYRVGVASSIRSASQKMRFCSACAVIFASKVYPFMGW